MNAPADTLDLLAFLDASPTPFHAVETARARLVASGSTALAEDLPFEIAPGANVHVVRSGTSIVALRIGTGSPLEHGFRMIGAHTDSPNLRIKPQPDLVAAGTNQVTIEPYGGVLYHTWLDRDLGLAGRVFVNTGGSLTARLVHDARALLRIPSLAIHLNRGVNTDGLVLNAQRHLPALHSLNHVAPLELRGLLASQLGVEPTAIAAWDLMLADVQPSSLLGARDEFVSAPRLDNLASCHAALTALVLAAPSEATRVVALFDHEEVGSRSAQGAAGTFLRDVLVRTLAGLGHRDADALPRAMARSFFVSADMAHAIHPNFADKHEPTHAPVLGRGPVVKSNVNQSYATDAETMSRFERFATDAGVEFQRFVTRSDIGCGSTIGPTAAASLGVRTVDVGLPMLSMHSCRELAATSDVPAMIRVLEAFFR